MERRLSAVTFSLGLALAFYATMDLSAIADSAPLPGMQSQTDNGSAFSDGGAPLPGAPGNSNFFQNMSQTQQVATQKKAPAQNKGNATTNGAAPGAAAYSLLPITLEQAQSRITELREKLEVSQPSQMQESIYITCEWMQELANSHWKMYQVFDKNESTKAQAKEEKALALEFSKLKNRAKLLKADLLIKQQRIPEAIDPLVEIVVAEPTSGAGPDAYKRLVDLGFSKNVASTGSSM